MEKVSLIGSIVGAQKKKKCYGQWNCLIWWSEFFFSPLVILSELIVRCVNEIWYVCESFRGSMEMVEMGHYFQMFNRIGFVCSSRFDDLFSFQSDGIAGFW
jgi:hypothetical protein